MREHGAPLPPDHLRSAGYDLPRRYLGHGEGYDYPHDRPEGVSPQELMPPEAEGERFLELSEHGEERKLASASMQSAVHAIANRDVGHRSAGDYGGTCRSLHKGLRASRPASLQWLVSLPTTDSPILARCSRRRTELDDGLRVRLRLTRPSDAARVRDFLERLSPETRQRRFLSPMPQRAARPSSTTSPSTTRASGS